MLATGAVLEKAGNQGIFGICRYHKRGHLVLAERLIGLQPPLAAKQVVERSACLDTFGDGDRPLKAVLGDVVDDCLEHALVADTRVDHGDAIPARVRKAVSAICGALPATAAHRRIGGGICHYRRGLVFANSDRLPLVQCSHTLTRACTRVPERLRQVRRG